MRASQNSDRCAVSFLIGLDLSDRDTNAAAAELKILGVEGNELGAPEDTSKSE
jgi:hypothetical protein